MNREQKSILIDNSQNLCEHGGLHPMIARKGKYIPCKVYNSTKETIIKIGILRVCLDLIQVKKFPSLIIMTYQREIWDVTFVSKNCVMAFKKKVIEEIKFSSEGLKQTWHKPQRRNIWSMQKNHNKIDRWLLHANRFR